MTISSSGGIRKRRRIVDEDVDDHPSGVDADVSYMEEDVEEEEEKKNLGLTSTYGGSEEKKKQQKIYLCVCLNFDYETEWYVFDRNSSSSEVGEFLREDILSAEVFLRGFACVVCGSKMYFLGGMDNKKYLKWYNCNSFDNPEETFISNEVKMYDTDTDISDDERRLVKIKSMIAPRWQPVVVYINNRIYVFGGEASSFEDPWAEYYDFETQDWIIIDRPLSAKHYKELKVFCHAIADCNRVILWDFHNFYLFNANQNTWDAAVQVDNGMHTISPPLLADDIVYWFFGNTIFKYDLTHPPSPNDYQSEFTFSKLWDGPPFEPEWQDPFLVPNGKEEFCLFWMNKGRLYCTAFKRRGADGNISWNDRYQFLRISSNFVERPHVSHCLVIHEGDMGQYSNDKRSQGSVVEKSQQKNSLDSKSFLENFSHTISNLCSNCYQRKYEEEEILRNIKNSEKPSESLDDLELLEDYTHEIDMSTLKGMSKIEFKHLDIPKIDKFKLLCKLGRESEATQLWHEPEWHG